MWVWKQSWMDAIPLCILRLNFRSNGHNRCHNPAPTSHLSIVQYVWTLTNVLSSASYLCQRGETADHTISFRFALMTDDSISLTRGMKSSKVGKGLKPAPHVLHGVAFTNVYILCGNVKRCSWLGFGLLPQMLHWILMNHQDFRLIKSPKKRPVESLRLSSLRGHTVHLNPFTWGDEASLSTFTALLVIHHCLNAYPYDGYINPYYWVDDHPLLYIYILLYTCKQWESRP